MPSTKSTPLNAVPWNDLKWLVPIVMAILSMFGTSFVAYTKNDKDVSNRLTTIESQRAENQQRLERIEHTTERLEDKIDRLVERGR